MQDLILESAIRATLIAIFTAAILYLLRVKAARVRHGVWTSVVVLMLALPVWTAWGPKAVVHVLNRSVSTEAQSTQVLPEPIHVAMPTPPVRQNVRLNWADFIAGIYLAGFLALFARLAIGTIRANRLTSASCAAPVTVGLFRPKVILPECSTTWPPAQLDAVLTHENAHARRRDPLVQSLALLNRAVFWFHPLAWWLERRLSALAEEACDAAVLARGHDPFEYSESLLAIARVVRKNGARVNVTGMAMSGTFLPQRIRKILESGPERRISRVRLASMAAAFAVVSAVFTAGTVGAADHTKAQANPSTRSDDQTSAFATPAPLPLPPAPVHARSKRPALLLAQAQPPTPAVTGSLSGTVEDPGGARVVQCDITVRDPTGASVALGAPDPAGFYQLTSLPPGLYNVEFAAKGFALLTVKTKIDPAKPTRIDAKLSLGQAFERITVIAAKPTSIPPSTPQPSEPQRIRIGGNVQIANLIKRVNPAYPPDLKQQGIEGNVIIRAVISKEGEPLNPRVVNTGEIDPRLADAALESVRQWRYLSARLNGEPVETLVTVTVEFQLK